VGAGPDLSVDLNPEHASGGDAESAAAESAAIGSAAAISATSFYSPAADF
jgi:hypothetical protein